MENTKTRIVESFGSRLRKAMDAKGLSQAKLSELSSISRSTINNYVKDLYEPSRERISLFASILGVSEVWLIGYDVPYIDKKINPAGAADKHVLVDHISVPMYGKVPNRVGRIDLSRHIDTFNVPAHLYRENVFAVLMSGDSMVRFDGRPFIADNSILIIDPGARDSCALEGKVCLVTCEGDTYIKQVHFETEHRLVRLISFNPNYRDIIAPAHDVKIEGEVISSFFLQDWS